MSTNGNWKALARSHRLLALALAAYIDGSAPNPDWDLELQALSEQYRNAGDLPGAGNNTAARAVLAAMDENPCRVHELLKNAADFYREGRADGQLIPSGAALLDRLRRILARTTPECGNQL